MVDAVAVSVAALLVGACPILSVISEQEGQHVLYNCFVELKMVSRHEDCATGSCVGSAHFDDLLSGQSVTINVAGSKCDLSQISNSGTFLETRLSRGDTRIAEHVAFSIGSDGRIVSASGYRIQSTEKSANGNRVICRGQNPVRRDLDLSR